MKDILNDISRRYLKILIEIIDMKNTINDLKTYME